ncbi:MAG: hypothetical protein Fur0023_16200 [Bacteroidia bacterium]
MSRFLLLFVAITLSLFQKSQNNIEELVRKIPSLSGKEKITTLSDVCFYLSVQNPKKAMEYGKQAVTLAQKEGDTILYASCLNDLSAAYFYASEYDTSIYYALKAYHLFIKNNKKRNAAGALTKVANSYFEMSDFKNAIEWNKRALELFKEENRIVEQGKVLNNIGSIYDKMNRLDFAKKIFLEAAELAEKNKDDEGYINAMGNYTIVLKKQDSLEKALIIFLNLLSRAEKINNPERLSILYQNIGLVYKNMKQYEKALYYLEKAKELSDKIDDKSSLSITYINMGICYMILENYTKAEEYIQKGIEISEQIKNKVWKKTGLFALYELYKKKKNFETACDYYEKAYETEKEIIQSDLNKEIAMFETKYKTLQKEAIIIKQQNKIYQNEISITKKSKYIYFLISSITLIILAFAFIYQRQKIKSRNNEISALKKLQSEKQRIARDLHDNLGAELTLSEYLLEAKSNKTNVEEDKRELLEIADKIRSASALMRDTIWTTINEELSIEQIGLRIKKFAEKLCEVKQIKVNYKFSGKPTSLTPDITLNLYRACQEIINNAVKYSQAKNINISIASEENITIKIDDDGVGFKLDEVKESYGIKNIFSRAEASLFKVNLNSNIGRGTSYEIKIDIK